MPLVMSYRWKPYVSEIWNCLRWVWCPARRGSGLILEFRTSWDQPVGSPWSAGFLRWWGRKGRGAGGSWPPPQAGGTCKGSRFMGLSFYIVCVWLCQILVSAHRVFSFHCSMWELVPQPRAPALWAQSQPLDHPGIPSQFIVILGGFGPGGRTGDKGKVRSGEQGFSASALASLRAGPFFVGGCPLQHRMLSVSGHLLPTPLNARSTPHRTWGCASQKCLWTLLNFCSHGGRSKITPVENHRLRTLSRGQGFETWVVKIPKERFPAHVAGL